MGIGIALILNWFCFFAPPGAPAATSTQCIFRISAPSSTSLHPIWEDGFLQDIAIGSRGRTLSGVVTLAAEAEGDAGVSVLGSTPAENGWFLGGLSLQDPLTGTMEVRVPFDALAAVGLRAGASPAEYGQATGGIVSVVTKSGSNVFGGSFDVRYSDENFREGSDDNPPWNPYDPSQSKSSSYNPALSLGGPILMDKVWFFVAAQADRTETLPEGSDWDPHRDGWNHLAKITWSESPNDLVTARWLSDSIEDHDWNASRFTAPETAARLDRGADLFSLSYNRILNDFLLLTVEAGLYRGHRDESPESGDLDTPPVFDLDTGYSSGNYSQARFTNRSRDEAVFSLEWFKNKWLGNHAFKAGAEYRDLGYENDAFIPGNRSYYVMDYTGDGKPDPYIKYVYGRVPPLRFAGRQWALYAQDEWSILPNLTLEPGLRYDAADYTNDTGRTVADFSKLQPRVGFTWDVFNDAKTVVRGHYGIYMNPANLSLPEYLRDQAIGYSMWMSSFYLAEYYGIPPDEVCDLFGPCDDEGFFLDQSVTFTGNTALAGLKPSHAEQWSVAISHEIAPRTGIELTYVQKRTRDILEDSCYGYDDAGAPIDPIDYIGDPDSYDPWTQCRFFAMRNNPYAKRYYHGAILNLRSRHKDWFNVMFDYTYSKAVESVGYTQGAGADLDLPVHYLNRYGYADGDDRHHLKLNGVFYLPAGFTAAFNAFYRTGRPYTRYADRYSSAGEDRPSPPAYGTLFLEKRGSRRLDSIWQIDLQATWAFQIANAVRTSLIASIYNATGNEAVTGRCGRWWSTDPNEEGAGAGGCGFIYGTDGTAHSIDFGDAIAWQTPRSYEVGLRIEF